MEDLDSVEGVVVAEEASTKVLDVDQEALKVAAVSRTRPLSLYQPINVDLSLEKVKS